MIHGNFKTEGWLTSVVVADRKYEKFFPLKPDDGPNAKKWNIYQEKRARYFDARWKARRAALQYKKFITSSAPNAGVRGTGVHGIQMDIALEASTGQYFCYFSVGLTQEVSKVAISRDRPLEKAWERAVKTWGKLYDIREKDIRKLTLMVPDVKKFEYLRCHLNGSKQAGIPAEAIRLVEIWSHSVRQRPSRKVKGVGDNEAGDVSCFAEALQDEIARFQRFRGKYR